MLVVTAVVVAIFTWLVWVSGNKVQDAIRDDADARIEGAKTDAAMANQKASEANALAEAARADAETARVEQEDLKKESLKLSLKLAAMGQSASAAQ